MQRKNKKSLLLTAFCLLLSMQLLLCAPFHALNLTKALTAYAYSCGTWQVSTPSGVKVRSEPGGGSCIAAAPNGETCEVIQVSSDWGYTESIRAYVGDNLDYQSGWIPLWYCCLIDSGSDNSYQPGYYTVSTSSGVKVRSQPSGGSYVAAAPNGERCAVTQISGNWGYTDHIRAYIGDDLSGRAGWIPLQYCGYEPFPPPVTTKAATQETATCTTTAATVRTTASVTSATAVKASAAASVQTTTTSRTTHTSLVTEPNDHRINWELDSWNFINSRRYIGLPPVMAEDYRKQLFGKVSNTEAKEMMTMLADDKRFGVCYGFSTLAVLNKMGYIINPDGLAEAPAYLRDVASSAAAGNPTQSLITYYYLLQCTDRMRFLSKATRMANNTNVMKTLIEKASNVKNGEYPLVVNYGFVEERNGVISANSFAHSVVAYDVEYGSWEIAPGYDGRILVYDCKSTAFEDSACIYFQSETMDWYIPYQKLRYDRSAAVNHAAILLVTNNEALLNHHGCLSEKRTKDAVPDDDLINPFYPEIIINGSDYSIRKATGSDTYAVNAAEMAEDEIYAFLPCAGGDPGECSYFMTDTESSYAVLKSIDGSLKAKMRYRDVSFAVETDMSHKIVFHPSASVSISGYNTGYRLDVVTNDAVCSLPWCDLEIAGVTPDHLLLTQDQNGYLLEGNFTGTIRVKATDLAEGRIAVSKDLSSYHKVRILSSETGNHMLDLRVDQDGDGICEHSVLKEIPGDVNCNGIINAEDFTLLKRFLLNGKKGIVNCTGLDMNRSGTIGTDDVVALLRYLTNQ